MTPVGMSEVRNDGEKNMNISSSSLDNIVNKELLGLIDKNIPLELRLDYLRLKNGLKLPRPRKNIILENIKRILKENDLNG